MKLETALARTQLALAVAFALGLAMAQPAFANDVIAIPTTENGYSVCGGGVCQWGSGALPRAGIYSVPQPQSFDDVEAAEKHFQEWTARCQPKVVFDEYGVGRYTYARRGCEFGGGR
jgi:hypothetical protein